MGGRRNQYMKPWASFDLIPRSHSENREGLGAKERAFARLPGDVQKGIQMGLTIRGHSVDVLISRQSSSPGGLEVQGLPVDLCLDLDKRSGPNRLGQQGRAGGQDILTREWSFLRDRAGVCCLDLAGETVPSPSVKMYLTVGSWGEDLQLV